MLCGFSKDFSSREFSFLFHNIILLMPSTGRNSNRFFYILYEDKEKTRYSGGGDGRFWFCHKVKLGLEVVTHDV